MPMDVSLSLILPKSLNVLSDDVIISDVNRMFAELKTHHIFCTVTQKISFEQHNKKPIR